MIRSASFSSTVGFGSRGGGGGSSSTAGGVDAGDARDRDAWAGASGAGGARRVTWAAALLLMGCAAAGLALFALSAADSSLLELVRTTFACQLIRPFM